MNVHKNARLTPHGRERIVRQIESGQTPKAVGEAAGVCARTVRKLISRYRSEGLAGLRDRSRGLIGCIEGLVTNALGSIYGGLPNDGRHFHRTTGPRGKRASALRVFAAKLQARRVSPQADAGTD